MARGSVDKNNPGINRPANWKGWAAIVTLLGMLAGLLFSRAVASISMLLFGIVALCDVHPKQWLRERWWLLGLGWIALYALSFFWTSNIEEWRAHLQVKLPFLLLPLAFAFLPPFSQAQTRVFTWGLTFQMIGGACYTLAAFWKAPDAAINSYKYAHVLPTPVYNDHISFSAMVALTIAWIGYYSGTVKLKWERALLICCAAVLALYLHILAAKTGLIALYIFFLALAIYYIRKAPRIGLSIVAAIVIGITAALSLLPTFRERIGYSFVTWRAYHAGERSGIYSDAGRVFSYDIALRYIAAHPLAGAGAGDVLDDMRQGYSIRYPDVPKEQQLWPHNQFLTCAMAAGIPCAVLFIVWLMAPFRRISRKRTGFYFTTVWAMLLVPLMVDPFLEVQAGVGVFLIFLLWQRKATIDSGLYFTASPLPQSEIGNTQSELSP